MPNLTIYPHGTRPLSRCSHDKMTLESLLNQFKSENSFLGRRRTRESLYGFRHVQNFYQIGRICSPAVRNEVLYNYKTLCLSLDIPNTSHLKSHGISPKILHGQDPKETSFFGGLPVNSNTWRRSCNCRS